MQAERVEEAGLDHRMPTDSTACWLCRRESRDLMNEPAISRWLAREGETTSTIVQRIPVGPPDLGVTLPVCIACECLLEAIADRVVEAALRDHADGTEAARAAVAAAVSR